MFTLNIFAKNTWKAKGVAKTIVLTDILTDVNGCLARADAKDTVVSTFMVLWLVMMKVEIVNNILSVLAVRVCGLIEVVF